MKFQKALFPLLVTALSACTSCTYNTTIKADEKDSGANNETATTDTSGRETNEPGETRNPSETASDVWLLTPGKSAGLTRLNENAEQMYQQLGQPDGGDASMQKAVAIWYTHHDSTNHSVAIYTSREPGTDPVARIQQIRITSPTFKTAVGIGPGSSLHQIQRAFEVKQTEQPAPVAIV